MKSDQMILRLTKINRKIFREYTTEPVEEQKTDTSVEEFPIYISSTEGWSIGPKRSCFVCGAEIKKPIPIPSRMCDLRLDERTTPKYEIVGMACSERCARQHAERRGNLCDQWTEKSLLTRLLAPAEIF